MSLLNPTDRSCLLTGLVLLVSLSASAAPTAASSTGEDDGPAVRRASRSSATGSADTEGSESRTVQMLLELQSSRAPLDGGERSRAASSAAVSQAAAPRPAAAPPAIVPAPAQNPFSRAVEMGRPATTRELRGPTVATAAAGDIATRPVLSPEAAALRGERYGEMSGPDAEQALRDKIGVQIPLPVALMRYIRENRSTVLICSLLSLALVGWLGARATQKRH